MGAIGTYDQGGGEAQRSSRDAGRVHCAPAAMPRKQLPGRVRLDANSEAAAAPRLPAPAISIDLFVREPARPDVHPLRGDRHYQFLEEIAGA